MAKSFGTGGRHGGANKPNQRMWRKSRQTLNHRGTSGRRSNNNNAQETGMSKLHVTSGTKTCNRLKSILLFPCDKQNTESLSHYTSPQNMTPLNTSFSGQTLERGIN